MLETSPKRLADDCGRAFTELGWGTLHTRVKNLPTALGPDAEPAPVVDAAALLANGKEVQIWAWPLEGEVIESKTDVARMKVAIRVGYFGDVDPTVDFVASLRAFLDGPPKREYGSSFELPPWPGTE